jgi:hypothetical protein
MAWSATLLRKEDGIKFVDFVVEFTDGTKIFIEQFRSQGGLDTNGIKHLIFARLAELDQLDTVDITIGEKDFTPPAKVPPPVKDPPTQEDLDFRAWTDKLQQLRTAEELVTFGAVADTHVTIVALRAAVVADFQEVFLARLGVV